MTERAHWEEKYRFGMTPWDLHEPHPELAARLAAGTLRPETPGQRAYVPGCGRGHDAIGLARAGWSTTAVDVVEGLREERGAALDAEGVRFVVGDALAFEDGAPFDLVFEHTFFCAIDPQRRADYGAMVRRLTRPGSLLAAIVFPVRKPLELGGPPFGADVEHYRAALGPAFELREADFVDHPVHRRSWGEKLAIFERR